MGAAMNQNLGRLGPWVWLIVLLVGGLSIRTDAAPAPEPDGKLVVQVTWGDLDKTPANDVYIEAHGFVTKFSAERSFVLKCLLPGDYEASIPPAVYDVFISEGTSKPECRRMLISAGKVSTWNLNLENDPAYTQK